MILATTHISIGDLTISIDTMADGSKAIHEASRTKALAALNKGAVPLEDERAVRRIVGS